MRKVLIAIVVVPAVLLAGSAIAERAFTSGCLRVAPAVLGQLGYEPEFAAEASAVKQGGAWVVGVPVELLSTYPAVAVWVTEADPTDGSIAHGFIPADNEANTPGPPGRVGIPIRLEYWSGMAAAKACVEQRAESGSGV